MNIILLALTLFSKIIINQSDDFSSLDKRYKMLIRDYPEALMNEISCKEFINDFNDLINDIDEERFSLRNHIEIDYLSENKEWQAIEQLKSQVQAVYNFISCISGCRDMDNTLSINDLEIATNELQQSAKLLYKSPGSIIVQAFDFPKLNKSSYLAINTNTDKFAQLNVEWLENKEGKITLFGHRFSVKCNWANCFETIKDNKKIKKIEKVEEMIEGLCN